MAELQIDRLEARYHLPPSRRGEKERLDRLLAAAAGEALEAGLERLGLSGEGELCIREVKVPLRLRLSSSDDALVLAWGDALAAAVETALREGDGETVLRFASRREALADFACGVARGDWRRGWAWRQLGLCAEGEEAGELARALAAEPEALVPILVAVAEAGWLPELARRFEAAWWPQLAALALTSVGWSSVSFSAWGGLAGWADDPNEHRRTRGDAEGTDARVAPEGTVADGTAAADGTDAAGSGTPGGLRPAEPGLAGLPAGLVSGLPLVLQRLGLSAALPELRRSRLAALFEVLQAAPASPLGQALAALAWLEVDPGKLRATAAAGRSELLAATAAVLAAAPAVASRPAAAPIQPAQPAQPAPPTLEAQPAAASPGQDGWTSRRLGLTEWGGLLFLVGVADDLGLPDEVAAHPLLGRRPGRWVWHQLALALVPAAAEDPAALAFAGLLPGNKSPAFEAEPASEEEQQALADLADRLLQEAASRYYPNQPRRLMKTRSSPDRHPGEGRGPVPSPDPDGEGDWIPAFAGMTVEPPCLDELGSTPTHSQSRGAGGRGPLSGQERTKLRDLICRRHARVLADPGWIEIHFSMGDVDTELRRARLDLDPGFVPWLGVVLRFVYE